MIYVCADCGDDRVHYIEFRTDGGAAARLLYPVNDHVLQIDDDELPKYLGGHYCEVCQSIVSIRKKED
jgi:hypothetical protein